MNYGIVNWIEFDYDAIELDLFWDGLSMFTFSSFSQVPWVEFCCELYKWGEMKWNASCRNMKKRSLWHVFPVYESARWTNS